jgi:hydroxymethylpyrimidine pyrophosphatase-like HAD family hydrolase
MRLSVLALDYDGTIASDGTLDSAARAAIAKARSSGIVVLIVTGRILSELRRVAGDLHFVDGVVAENGAVVHFPRSDYTTLLAPPVPDAFLADLTLRGIHGIPGQCLVDAAADDALRLLEVIRALELPLVLVFNRSRVMVLPQGVSKATGLHTALTMLRRSVRNTLAIGDAENDFELLRVAEVGVAAEWGSPSLRVAADQIAEGTGPAATADYIERLVGRMRLPGPRGRRRLHLGYTDDGLEFSLAVRGRNVLVAGDAKSGKSWVAGMLCEQLILHGYSVCVLDPEGDYTALEALPGVAVLGGNDRPPTPRELLKALQYPDRSVVIDLTHLSHEDKIEYVRAALPALNIMRRRTGIPHRIVVDEAHYFLHDEGARKLLDFELNGYTVVTYCASRLPPELLDATEVILVTCESKPAELDALLHRCVPCQQADRAYWRERLRRLAVGEAIALPITAESDGELRLVRMGQRLTPHVRHREKYVDVPVTEHRAFLFTSGARARTLREFLNALDTDGNDLDGFLRRGDFSRWLNEVFGDHALADSVREHEARYRRGHHPDAIAEIAEAIRARYDVTDEEDPSVPVAGVRVSPPVGASS